MKIIKPSVELINPKSIESPVKHLEKCARVCYKSERNIKEGSAERFVSGLIKSGHLAAVEHYRFIFSVPPSYYNVIKSYHLRFVEMTSNNNRFIVSSNIRALLEAYENSFVFGSLNQIIYEILRGIAFHYNTDFFLPNGNQKNESKSVRFLELNELTKEELYAHGWFTAHFICDRGVSHEIVRHRDSSFCQESSRYCSYFDDKFGNEITVIKPCFWDESSEKYFIWECANRNSESEYFKLLKNGSKPQEARSVLTNSLKTELYMTSTIGNWIHFFLLRCDKAAHPQMREVALPLLDLANENFEDLFNETWEKFNGKNK